MGELLTISPPLQALLAGLVTWGLTALGAAMVLMIRRPHPVALDAMLAFGAGVMLAASFFSLLAPAVELAETLRQSIAPLALGFLLGGLLLLIADALLAVRLSTAGNMTDTKRRNALLIAAITVHNIPEGLAIGVAFGALASHPTPAGAMAAWMLALGIALQNFPEGAAVSLPLRRDGMSRAHAFFWGQASALVEPAAAVVGAVLALAVQALLPAALSFAAGAMVVVVIAELIPESQQNRFPMLMAFWTMLGFTAMMILDLALG